jgi:hypothetical protein
MRYRPLVFLLALSIASVAFACGDDDGSKSQADPLAVYYDGLADAGSDFVDALARQPQGLDRSAPIAQQVDVYETYARGLSDEIKRARDDLQDLDPPPLVADEHAALLAAVENALTVAESVEDLLGDINSSEELQSLATNPDIANALLQFQTACSALRDIANQNDIQREVRCE